MPPFDRTKLESSANGCGLEVSNLTYRVSTSTILRNISLSVRCNSGLSIVGPSGSGKTTLLRCLAGLESLTEGTVIFRTPDGRALTPKDVPLGFVFQDLGIFERSTVEQNVFLGEKQQLSGRHAASIFDTLGLSDKLQRDTRWLSGGERQRVAIARALVRRPAVLFLDEPFSNIDPTLSVELELLLAQLQHDNSFTLIYVTHNVDSAIRLNPWIAFLSSGQIEQVGTPSDLHNNPASREILAFFSKLPIAEIGASWQTTNEDSDLTNGSVAFARPSAIRIIANHPGPDDHVRFCKVRFVKRLHTIPEPHYVVHDFEADRLFVAVAGDGPDAIEGSEKLWAIVRYRDLFTFDGTPGKKPEPSSRSSP
jgi:ABC-type sugar transport system ATPase subunit